MTHLNDVWGGASPATAINHAVSDNPYRAGRESVRLYQCHPDIFLRGILDELRERDLHVLNTLSEFVKGIIDARRCSR